MMRLAIAMILGGAASTVPASAQISTAGETMILCTGSVIQREVCRHYLRGLYEGMQMSAGFAGSICPGSEAAVEAALLPAFTGFLERFPQQLGQPAPVVLGLALAERFRCRP